MAKPKKKPSPPTRIDDYSMQKEFDRPSLPTGEYSGIEPADLAGVPPAKPVCFDIDSKYAPAQPDLSEEFAARDPDLDPQYIWRGKTRGDINALEVKAPIIYQQEKIFPRMLIEDLRRRAARRKVEEYRHDAIASGVGWQETFDDIDPGWDPEAALAQNASFYDHQQGWKNRLILGDSLPVMASLAENEQMRGKVQMIYIDPPYGIKFNSNWQPTTKSTNVKDGAASDITREPEMVKAFRDTWHDGIHSYLGYLRDRLVVARDLLTESGSCFVQIGDANVHKVRAVMEEVFGEENYCGSIQVQKTTGAGSPAIGTDVLASVMDTIVWFAKDKKIVKYRQLYQEKVLGEAGTTQYKHYRDTTNLCDVPLSSVEQVNLSQVFAADNLTSQSGGDTTMIRFPVDGKQFVPGRGGWKTNYQGLSRLDKALRLKPMGNTLMYRRYLHDFGVSPINNLWQNMQFTGFGENKIYVVQTGVKIIQRCMLMTTDPGDLVLDPTCGSGTTAYVAEQWGRRWITIDTSRVALALARQRLMTAKFPYYLLADSPEGLRKETEVTGKAIDRPTYGKVSQGFVYERVPHITLKGIANNAEIDVIWEKYEAESERLRRIMGGVDPE